MLAAVVLTGLVVVAGGITGGDLAGVAGLVLAGLRAYRLLRR